MLVVGAAVVGGGWVVDGGADGGGGVLVVGGVVVVGGAVVVGGVEPATPGRNPAMISVMLLTPSPSESSDSMAVNPRAA